MLNRNSDVDLRTLPKVDIQRSIFNKPFAHKTTFDVGEVVPFFLDEVLPGSTFNITTSVVARLQTLVAPIMDNLYMDTYYFFVPNRLVFDHWAEFCGENKNAEWIFEQPVYEIPYLTYPYTPDQSTNWNGFEIGTIADYMGIPTGVSESIFSPNFSNKDYPSALPFRGYALIMNEFFRDQNLQPPVHVYTDDQIRMGSNGSNQVTDIELGGKPFIAARYHDYFSSCLPAPQKSPDVSIFGTFNNGPSDGVFGPGQSAGYGPFAPVITRDVDHFYNGPGNVILNPLPSAVKGYMSNTTNSYYSKLSYSNSVIPPNPLYFAANTDTSPGFTPSNLWANLNIPEATINNLRLAFQLQKYYEKSARGGTRYREYLREFFGVQNGDARMQVPEYLGGHRIPLSIHQVANQSETGDAKLGDLGAMSNTSDVHEDVHMSFSEHGFIFGLAVVRYDNTYSQGLAKMWSRRNILDYYNPVFANIGEQPVYKRELSLGLQNSASDASVTPDEVFGYNEAWADYRFMPSRVSSEMRPEAPQTLAYWHLADDYQYAPSLSAEWIRIDKTNVDRVLNVTSEVSKQVFADFFVQNRIVLPMPMHSIPGLADHH